jgi:hypothetical protein
VQVDLCFEPRFGLELQPKLLTFMALMNSETEFDLDF